MQEAVVDQDDRRALPCHLIVELSAAYICIPGRCLSTVRSTVRGVVETRSVGRRYANNSGQYQRYTHAHLGPKPPCHPLHGGIREPGIYCEPGRLHQPCSAQSTRSPPRKHRTKHVSLQKAKLHWEQKAVHQRPFVRLLTPGAGPGGNPGLAGSQLRAQGRARGVQITRS